MTSKKIRFIWDEGWFGIIAWDAVPSACPVGGWFVVVVYSGCGGRLVLASPLPSADLLVCHTSLKQELFERLKSLILISVIDEHKVGLA